MRPMIAFLMVTTVLFAQDPAEPPPTEAPPAAPQPAGKPGPAKERRAEIERILQELQELEGQLGDDHDAVLRQLIARLRDHERALEAEVIVVGKDGRHDLGGGVLGLRLLVAPDGGETITGSFDDDGRKGKYKLTSAGEGRYRLEADVAGENGTNAVVKDQGTLAELQRKYKWLRGGMIIAPHIRSEKLLLDALQLGARSKEPVIGVLVRSPADELRHHLEIPVGGGLVVAEVTPGSRAERLGLRQHDVLLRIDGDLVEDPKQVKKLAGKGVTLEYVRRAKKKRLVTE